MALAADEREEGEVATAAGVSASQLSRWKSGAATPLVTNVPELVLALGVNGHWLLTGEGDMALPTGDEVTRLRVIGRISEAGRVDPEALEAMEALSRPGSTQEIGDAIADWLRKRASGE